MNKIEVEVLNPEVITNCEKMMVCAARLTQGGHKIKSLDDFMELYNKYERYEEYYSLYRKELTKNN